MKIPDPGLDDMPPSDFRSLRALIATRRETLPKRLAQLADYSLAHPQDIAFGRVADLAARAGTQPSALIRFAQSLGYEGFSDMQSVFLDHARERWPDYRERMRALAHDPSPNAGAAELLDGFINAASLSLERLRETIDTAALDRAAGILASAGTIHAIGSRRAFPLAAYFAYALRKLAIRCELSDQAGGLGLEQIALLDPGDAVLAISFTPYAPSTLELSASAQRRGLAVVAITDTPFSPLTQSASVWLEVAEADHAAFRSLAGGFTLATTLAVATARQRDDGTKIPS